MPQSFAPSISRVFDKDFLIKKYKDLTEKNMHELSTSKALEEYVVNFDCIFSVEDMFQAFWKHLDWEKCPEQLEFLVALNNFLDESTKDVNMKSLTNIIETFIKSNSVKELNLSSGTKNNLMSKLKKSLEESKWVLDETPGAIFKDIQKTILLELKLSTFPRFVRKNLCQVVIIALKFDTSVVKLRQNIEFPYTDEDFKHKVITDKDIAFMKSILTDSLDWSILFTGENLNTFWTKKEYMKGVSYYTLPCVVRFEIVLPYSLQKVAAAVMSTKEIEKWDPKVKRVTIVEDLGIQETKEYMDKEKIYYDKDHFHRSNVVSTTDMILPFPYTTPRKLNGTSTLEYDPITHTLLKVGRVVITDGKSLGEKTKQKVFVDQTGSEVEKECYSTVDTFAHHIQRIDDHKTLYKQTHVFSPNGWAASITLQKMVSKIAGGRVASALLAHLKTRTEETWEDVVANLKNDPFVRMLKEVGVLTSAPVLVENIQILNKTDEIKEEVPKIEETPVVTESKTETSDVVVENSITNEVPKIEETPVMNTEDIKEEIPVISDSNKGLSDASLENSTKIESSE